MTRHRGYPSLDVLTESELRRYYAELAAKRRRYPDLYNSAAAAAGLRARIIRERHNPGRS